MNTPSTRNGWAEEQVQQLIGQRIRLLKPMNGLQPGLMGTVTRAELIGHEWVVFVEWHLAAGEPYEDPFDRMEWERYLDLW